MKRLAAAFVISLLLIPLLPFAPLVSPVFSEKSPASAPGRGLYLSSFAVTGDPDAGLSKGKFLVAGRNMRDSRFVESVILLLEYEPSGALGVIINRPTGMKLSALFPEIQGLKRREDTIYAGGPVGQTQVFLLLRSVKQPEESLRVFDNVYVSSSLAAFRRATEKSAQDERFRLYVGYSGWTKGQLENEVSRGDWHVIQADPRTLFEKPASEIWPTLIQKASAQWVYAAPPVYRR